MYLYVKVSGSITSVGEEKANLSAVVYLLLCGFCLERFPLPLGTWDVLCYLILLWHSLSLPYNYFLISLPSRESMTEMFMIVTHQYNLNHSHSSFIMLNMFTWFHMIF